MDTMIFLLAALTMLPRFVVPEASFRAVVEIVSGDSRIFSGKDVKLKCNIHDVHKSTWSYLWFKGSVKIPQSGEHLVLWNVGVKESGNFSCQGERDTVVGKVYTLPSLSVEIQVDGGWAILQAPLHPSIVGETLRVSCSVRGSPKLHQVILYKDGVEVMRGVHPNFHLTNLTLEDRGMYSCRASWDANMHTYSVISVNIPVQILEILSEPVLVIDANINLIGRNMMMLTCHHQYNTPAPAPSVHYYFYRNNMRVGIATSENHSMVNQTPGQYSCKVRVPKLDLVRWSKPISYGEEVNVISDSSSKSNLNQNSVTK